MESVWLIMEWKREWERERKREREGHKKFGSRHGEILKDNTQHD